MTTPQVIGALGEAALIQIFAEGGGAPGPEVLIPNGDDAAAFRVPADQAVVVTTDALVEGVHFDLAYSPPVAVGRKLLAVNLSDVAAMGATPRYVFLALALPASLPVAIARAIATGVQEQCRAHRVVILGGNVSRTPGPAVLTATLLGEVAPGEVIARGGARAGDAILVTGALGDAHAGLELVRAQGTPPAPDHPSFALFSALVDPEPRVAAGRALAESGLVRSMCDVSDGLGRDVTRLLEGGALGARLEAARLPISIPLRDYAASAGAPAEVYALQGGEDYELLFTVAPADVSEVTARLKGVGTRVTAIGEVTQGPGIEVVDREGRARAVPAGFDHFGGRAQSQP